MTAAPSHLQWLNDPQQRPANPTQPACWVIDTSEHHDENTTILRRVLGMHLGVPADALDFAADAFGRAILSQDAIRSLPGAGTLDFSVSHCAGTLVIGLCSRGRIGVDVELATPAGWEATARDCLTPQEQRRLHAATDPAAAFLQLWTAKEAIAKALGLGVQVDFRGIELEQRDGRLCVVRVQHSESLAAGWILDSMGLPKSATREPGRPRGIVTVATVR